MITQVGYWREKRIAYGATSVEITSPDGVVAGDLLFSIMRSGLAGGTTAAGEDSMAGGWTKIATAGIVNERVSVFWRFATGAGEKFTASWDSHDTDRSGNVHLIAYRGVHSVGTVAGTNGWVSNTSDPVVTRSMPAIAGSPGSTVFGFAANTSSLELEASWAQPLVGITPFHAIAGTYPYSDTPATYTDRATYSGGHFNLAVVLMPNVAPNAPVLAYPVGQAVDRNVSQRFEWDFSDPNTGDTPSAYSVRYRPAGTSYWPMTVTVFTPVSHHDFPAGTFTAGEYEWQASTRDALGLAGPWSASAFFTAGDPVTTHTITDPPNNATISTPTYVVSWSTPEQDAYQAQVVDGETVLFDTGTVENPSARQDLVEFADNEVDRAVRVRIRYGGLWSAWASVLVHLSYTAPAVPSLSVVGDNSTGSITVAPSYPEPTGTQPVVESFDVWVREVGGTGEGMRIARSARADRTFTWWLPAAETDYEFRVRAIGEGGASVFSPWEPGTTLPPPSGGFTDHGDGTYTITGLTSNGDGTYNLGGTA